MIVNTLHIRVGGDDDDDNGGGGNGGDDDGGGNGGGNGGSVGGGGNGGGGSNGGGGGGGDISAEQKSINGHQSLFTLCGIQNIIHSLKYVDKAMQRSN
jgi:hypothetical protein